MPLRMPKFRFTRRLGKILLGVVATALILCGIAAWQVPKVLHNVLTQDVAKMLGRDVAVGKITFNPFTLTVRAQDLAVAQPGSQTPLFTASELNVSAAWTSLFWFAPVVDRFTLRSPTLSIVREDVTRFNFSDVQQRVAEMTAPKPDEPPKPDEGLPRFSLNNMVIEGGVITLDDKVTGRKQVVDELAIGVPFISTFGYATDIDVQPRLHLRINGSPFDLTGVARPFDKVPSSTLRVAFSGLQLEKWADVWPMPLPFKLERALLDSNLQVVFEQPKDAPPKIRVVGDLGLRQFDLRDSAGESLHGLERADRHPPRTRTDRAPGIRGQRRPVGAAGVRAPLQQPAPELAGCGRQAQAVGRPGAGGPSRRDAGGETGRRRPAGSGWRDRRRGSS